MRYLLSIAVLGLVVGLTIPDAAAAEDPRMPDTITRRDGSRVRQITVTEATTEHVAYRAFQERQAEIQTVPSREVVEIGWGDARQFAQAIRQVEDGEWERALALIERGVEPEPRSFWYQPYRAVILGRILLETGKAEESLEKFDVVLDEHPNSFYVLEAIQAKARAHRELGQHEQAIETYRKMAEHGPLWELVALEGQAEAHLIVENQEEAMGIYERLVNDIGQTLRNPGDLEHDLDQVRNIYQRALVGKGQVLVDLGRADDATRWIDSIEDRITERANRLRLYMALGDLHFEAGRRAEDETEKKVNLNQAVLSYMRVYILYPEARRERPKAMFGAATASVEIGGPAARTRARRLYRELIENFPDSDVVDDARTGLRELGG